MKHPEIAKRLIQTRLALGYEQTAFAEQAGVHQPVYNGFERGKRGISIATALKIRDRFGIPLDWIFCGDASRLPRGLSLGRSKSASRQSRGADPAPPEAPLRRRRSLGPARGMKFFEIANRLMAMRLALGYEAQGAFAKQIGASTLYSPWERGKKRIPIKPAIRIRDKFGIPLDWIYCGDRRALPASLRKKLKRARGKSR